MFTFHVGDRVVKNPAAWVPSEFDEWGRGEGVGIVLDSGRVLGSDLVDVRWAGGRCYEARSGLLPAPPADEEHQK